uniref:Phosphoserine phosphatase n=1 Tax=Takifugu rubripes TaxID=31033 RepID=H2USD2_TAKRU
MSIGLKNKYSFWSGFSPRDWNLSISGRSFMNFALIGRTDFLRFRLLSLGGLQMPKLSRSSKPLQHTMTTLSQTKELFRRAEAVCFDVDSTVIREEGIDELAKFCGVGDAVTEMTRKAMGGSMTFKMALTERLSIIRCSREQVNKLITDHPPQLTPGIRELVDSLHQRNVKVFLISGGFRCIVEHVAAQLNIPQHHVYANRLKFYFNGEYAGFDESQPTAESGGKGKVISILKEQYGFKTVVMIGDGATDLEACPPASAFIGFGGNVVRQQVKERCS